MPHGTAISGTITCRETGAATSLEHYLYPANSRMTSIVQVIHAELYEHVDASEPFQISVDVLALDAIGTVIELGLEFRRSTREASDALLQDMPSKALLLVSGEYTCADGAFWAIQNPDYQAVPEEELEELNRVFQVNYRTQYDELTLLTTGHAGKLVYDSVDATIAMLADEGTTALCRNDLLLMLSACNSKKMSLGRGRASGKGRMQAAVEVALHRCFPKLQDYHAVNAIALSIQSSADMTMDEYEEVTTLLLEHFRDDIHACIGVAINEALTDCIEITLLAGI